jgi:hypothetical protein
MLCTSGDSLSIFYQGKIIGFFDTYQSDSREKPTSD